MSRAATVALESNYVVEDGDIGILEVKEYDGEIEITTVGGTFTYDGKEHDAEVIVPELPEGYTLKEAGSEAKATDVTGEDGVEAKCDNLVIENADGEVVTANLNIKFINGKIVINPAELLIETSDAKKIYDGKPLTKDGTIQGLVNGETVTFKTTGTQTEVGSSKNTYSLLWDGTAKESNYKLIEKVGTLTVEKKNEVNTGDNTPLATSVELLLVSVTGLLGMLYLRKKDRE